MKRRIIHTRTVTLAGNPNVGKSTLFNSLTGLHQHTGNWSGKTVELAQGRCRFQDTQLLLVDLPGTYGLDGGSEEQQLAGRYIQEHPSDCTLVVCDGCCLERSLILALEILRRADPVVVCVNLMDEARRRGISIDLPRLSQLLGVPVVATSAGDKRSLQRLLSALCQATPSGQKIAVSDPISQAAKIANQCSRRLPNPSELRRQKLDRLLVSPGWGVGIMLCLFFFIIWLTVWGANIPSGYLERLFSWLYGYLNVWCSPLPPWLSSLLLDGMYTTCAQVLAVMVPPMAIFFPLFTVLEDVGYLPRMAFLLDGKMAACGGCGKQALTMCMGLGCNAVGVTGCRIIDSPKERLLAILTNAMIPCNGRFPTLILLATVFFPGPGGALAVAGCVALGILGAMAASGVLSRTVLRHQESAFFMELPPFRRPRFGQILLHSLVHRTLKMALRAIVVSLPAGALLWALSRGSTLQAVAGFLEPVGLYFGMSGAILLGFCFSLPANELLLPVIFMILSGAGSLQGLPLAGSDLLLAAGWTWKTAVCTMVFSLFHWPCATTLMTIHRETGSYKKTVAAFLLPTVMGLILCRMLHLVLR